MTTRVWKWFLLLLSLLTMLGSGEALAAPAAGNFEVSPFVGYYWFDNETDYDDDLTWGARFGYLYNDNLEAELAVAVVDSELGSGKDADLLQLQIDALYNFTGMGKLVPYAAAGIGLAHYDPKSVSAQKNDFLINYGVGARYMFTDNLAARVDLRQPIVFDDTDFNLMATAGISYFFGAPKKPVKVEAAPAPAPAPVKPAEPAPVKEQAPAPPADRDGDGVVDGSDRCPDTPKGISVDLNGCPFDGDGDGVYDYLDKCADTPRQAKVDSNGCPLDSDRDGVYDYLDQCPRTPAGAKVDVKGCQMDSDGDGVTDDLDKCPDTTAGAPVDATGCLKDSDRDGLTDWEELKLFGTDPMNPDSDNDGLTDGEEVKNTKSNPLNPDTDGGSVNDGVEVNTNRTNPLDPADDVKKEIKRIELKVYFDTNSDVVKPQYFTEIEQVATFLKENPGVSGTVEGHTDSRGSAALNQGLSERRAKSVIKVAESRFGVEAGRLTGAGYGGTRPVADNGTEEGRARNRRIEAAFTSR